MKILHTSDWHLGRALFGKKRYTEFSAFLDWLLEVIHQEKIDILLVAGDIFDTNTPSNKAQQLYFDFLVKAIHAGCDHVVVIGGNHDSPSLLNAPKDLLHALNIHVVGAKMPTADQEVFTLQKENIPQAIICAVPYLRDKDIRLSEAGESLDEKNAKLVSGVQQHYADVCAIAEERQESLRDKGFSNVPIIAMGHLFTAGGKVMDGDGVRDLYVGSLAHVHKDIFPSSIDYFALGHLHIAQKVGGTEHIRYCGSPIPMGFGEANQQKKVLIITFEGQDPTVQEFPIPVFQKLMRIKGDLSEILTQIDILKEEQSQAWLEIEYIGQEIIPNLRDQIETSLDGTELEIIKLMNKSIMQRVIKQFDAQESLENLTPDDVFQRRLDQEDLSEDEQALLKQAYGEILQAMHDSDVNAE